MATEISGGNAFDKAPGLPLLGGPNGDPLGESQSKGIPQLQTEGPDPLTSGLSNTFSIDTGQSYSGTPLFDAPRFTLDLDPQISSDASEPVEQDDLTGNVESSALPVRQFEMQAKPDPVEKPDQPVGSESSPSSAISFRRRRSRYLFRSI